MKLVVEGALGIDQGSEMLFSDFQDGGPMWAGRGTRELRRPIRFSSAFNAPPVVSVNIGLWDADAATNLRSHIEATRVEIDGFEIVFRTWGDTRIARLRADWLAFGPVAHPDNWKI